MKQALLAAVLAAYALSAPAQQSATDHAAHHPAPAAGQVSLADGEVRRIDLDAGKITLRHGPIASIDMPPMTMVFQVKDRALLSNVKSGDKIRFRAGKEGGTYFVTYIEPAQ